MPYLKLAVKCGNWKAQKTGMGTETETGMEKRKWSSNVYYIISAVNTSIG